MIRDSLQDKRVLVAVPNWLGDALMVTPVFKTLKNRYNAYTAVLCVDRVSDVFRDNIYVDEIIIFDDRGKDRSIFAKFKLLKKLRQQKFDVAFLVQRSFTKALIAALAKIPVRVGYQRLKNRFVLTQEVMPAHFLCHRQDIYFSLFKQAGVVLEERIPQFFVPEDIRSAIGDKVNELRKNHVRVVCVHVSSNWEQKRWPPHFFSWFCDQLVKDFNCAVIFIGSSKEQNIINRVTSSMDCDYFDFCGKTSLKELGALFSAVDLVVSNDSGPAHLAGAMGANLIVLFGPTSPEVTAPRGENVTILSEEVSCAVPCYKKTCTNNICMKKITVERVVECARKILS
ncbi:MAG: lipopolysaccharide heptosyltransferase II [Candidatus Omnitrophica bacterium]|nr:lipopolysaccharide heptosyltransferase II [Candidatus Omnitrophota bacterium]